MIKAYERLGYKVDVEFIMEYLQHPDIAMDFANYYDLYNRYRKDYHISDILLGNTTTSCAIK